MPSPPSENLVASKENDYENAAPSGDNSIKTSSPPDPEMSSLRRAILLTIFCLALFVDAFMTSAVIISLDSVSSDARLATVSAFLDLSVDWHRLPSASLHYSMDTDGL